MNDPVIRLYGVRKHLSEFIRMGIELSILLSVLDDLTPGDNCNL